MTVPMKKPGELDSHLEKLIEGTTEILNFMIKNEIRNDENLVIFNIIKYCSNQVLLIRNNWRTSIESCCSVARNMLEINLVLTYILQDEKHLKSYLVARALDEIEIYESIVSTIEKNGSNQFQIETMERHILEKKELIQKNGFSDYIKGASIFKNATDLAKKTGKLEDFKMLHKLFSKYSHPSSWIINGTDENSKAHEFKMIAVVNIQRLLYEIIDLAQKKYNQDFIKFFKLE